MNPRVFVSVPDDRHLDRRRRLLKRAVIGEIAATDVEIVGFEPEQFGLGLPASPESWTADRAKALLQSCDGLLVLALARTFVQVSDSRLGKGRARGRVMKPVATTYNHLEGALAFSLGMPIFLVSESGMDRDGIFQSGIKGAEIPDGATEKWVHSDDFRRHLPVWRKRIGERQDVFFGYCSKVSRVAEKLRDGLESAGHTVADWSRDFKRAGTTILEEIEGAAERCRAAIFLFTRDDELARRVTAKASFSAVPRDNVLLEAGYFTRARGKSRVAIVCEKGAKMPADLGGVVYIEFENRRNLSPTIESLLSFLESALSSHPTTSGRVRS
jgi:hypothetical protein